MTETEAARLANRHLLPPPIGSGWVIALLASSGLAAMAGAIMGLLWGGIGGRIAMRVLFLTTGDRVRGVTSDDGFEIGVISFDTVALFIFTAILGALAGAIYGLVRMMTPGPTWLVAAGVGIAAAAGEGAALVRSDGIDFKFLDPLWLAVLLFVMIPALWGVTSVLLTERLIHAEGGFGEVPSRIDERRFGAVGWSVLGVITVFGIIDLLADIDRLT